MAVLEPPTSSEGLVDRAATALATVDLARMGEPLARAEELQPGDLTRYRERARLLRADAGGADAPVPVPNETAL